MGIALDGFDHLALDIDVGDQVGASDLVDARGSGT
jgi:hypothetical protein